MTYFIHGISCSCLFFSFLFPANNTYGTKKACSAPCVLEENVSHPFFRASKQTSRFPTKSNLMANREKLAVMILFVSSNNIKVFEKNLVIITGNTAKHNVAPYTVAISFCQFSCVSKGFLHFFRSLMQVEFISYKVHKCFEMKLRTHRCGLY